MNYIKGFDSLRAVSIIFVIAGHLGLYAVLPETEFVRARVWHLISGTTGVQIFFTLSGFLITSILLKEKRQDGRIVFKNFYARRFLRLLPPLIIFYIAIAILMQQDLIKSTGTGLLFSVFYLYNFVPKYYYTVELGHTWSLAVEEQFYLIWPFVIRFINNYKTTLLLILGLIIACSLSGIFFSGTFWTESYTTERWFIPAVAPVLTGSFFGVLNEHWGDRMKQFFKNNFLLFFVAIVFFLSPLYLPISVLEYRMYSQSLGIAVMLTWIFHNQQSLIVTFADNPILSYIGKISYGLYVYQGLFLRTGPGGILDIQQFPLNLLLTVLTAIISFHLIEKPALKLKNKFRS